jgi:hypothetical protein
MTNSYKESLKKEKCKPRLNENIRTDFNEKGCDMMWFRIDTSSGLL